MSAALPAESWAGLREWVTEAVEELLEPGDERVALADALSDLDGLDRLEHLDGLSPAERLGRLASVLDVVFSRPAGNHGRFGVGPVVGSLQAIAGANSELLFVLGCREGELPGPQGDDPLLPRSEREQVPSLAGGERADERGRRHLLWAVLGATRPAASFARIDVRAGRAAYPSRWAVELFGGRPTDVPSFAGSIRQVAEGMAAADVTDFELASLVAAGGAPWRTFLEQVDRDYGRRRRSALERRAGGLNPYAGYVPETGTAEDAWAYPMSATGLEAFACCPFRFFVERKLGVKRLEQPERLVTIDARDRGTMMHAVLEQFFGALAFRSP